DHHATRRFRWGFAAMLAALGTLGPFCIDAYLPAFGGIQQSLHASPLEIQQTLSAYLFALALMFLFHVALSDSFGRRPVARFLPETLPITHRQPFHPMALIKGYEEVGMSRVFLLLSIAAGFNFNGFFLYIVSAPVFLGEHLRLAPTQYAWLFIPCIAGIMFGAHLSGRAAGRHSPARMVERAYLFMGTAAAANLAYAFLAEPAIPWAVIPVMVYGIGFAIAMPS